MRFHETVHGVYFDDLDAFKVLHNARYVLLFERTIGAFWQHLGYGGFLDHATNPDQYHVVRANHFEYERPVDYVGNVRVRVWIEHLGNTSLRFAGMILPMDSDTPHARASRTLVRVDPATMRPIRWTDGFRTRVAPWVAEAQPRG
jgi:acyl-CoA thioester hydrolase